MSGQKYKRTHFDEEESMSTSGTPPGVVYDPAIAFKVGATFWQKRSNLERLLFIVVTALLLTVIILSALLMSKNPSTQHTFPQGKINQTRSSMSSTRSASQVGLLTNT